MSPQNHCRRENGEYEPKKGGEINKKNMSKNKRRKKKKFKMDVYGLSQYVYDVTLYAYGRKRRERKKIKGKILHSIQ